MPLTKVKSGGVSDSITLTSPDINAPDIDGGTIDNAVIGGSTAAAGSFTTITATGGSSSNWNTAYGWGDHSTQSYATQTYVGTEVSNLVDSSPAALNTLNELAAALGDDPNFATTVTNSIALKAPLASPSFTGNVSIAANNSGQGAVLTLENTDTAITTNDVVGQIDFYANDGSTGGTGQKATIQATAQNGSGTSVGLIFGTSPFPDTTATERMRIDSSGNVLVGKTAADNTTAGTRIHPAGYASFTIANDYPIIANRLSSDGDIAVFRKDNTTVGSIGAASGDLNINGPAGHSGIRFQASSILPRYDGADTDGTMDIGYNDGTDTHRWRHLYLSGKIAKGTGGELDLRSDGGGFKYKQNLDVATAGCTFTGQSNRGDVAQIRLYQTATGADGGYIRFDTSNSGSTTPTEKARIHSEGFVTTPYQPTWGASGLSNTSSSGGTSSAGTLVFSGLLNNNGNHYSNSTGLFTAPVAGQYFVTFSGLYDDSYNVTGPVYIRRNTANLYKGYHQNSGSNYVQISMSGVVECSAGDTISIYSSIAGWHIGGETSWSGFLIG